MRCFVLLLCLSAFVLSASGYEPSDANLKARESFQEDRFGVFIHWGVYSVLGRGEWVMNNEKMTVEQYEKLPPQFNPVKFDADKWVKTFKLAGARYVTITSKHHDGFCMWDSKQTDWDIVDRTPYAKDVIKQMADACQRHKLKLFLYHSQLDWRHPDYYPRGSTGQHSGRPDEGNFPDYMDYMDSQLTELLNGDYGPIGGIWFDGWWDQQSKRKSGKQNAPVKQTEVDWRLENTYSLIHRLQPACLVGANHHVAPFPGEDFQMFERDLPGENKGGHSQDSVIGDLPLETCDTINNSWGYSKGDQHFKSVKQLVHYLVRSVGRNANLLLNVGPRPDGTLDPQSVERLLGMGEWLEKNGHTIYGASGGPYAPQSWGVSTQRDAIYLHVLSSQEESEDGWLTLSGVKFEAAPAVKTIDGKAVLTRISSAGELEVSPQAWDPIDTILVLPR